jgi:hypothetical protein
LGLATPANAQDAIELQDTVSDFEFVDPYEPIERSSGETSQDEAMLARNESILSVLGDPEQIRSLARRDTRELTAGQARALELLSQSRSAGTGQEGMFRVRPSFPPSSLADLTDEEIDDRLEALRGYGTDSDKGDFPVSDETGTGIRTHTISVSAMRPSPPVEFSGRIDVSTGFAQNPSKLEAEDGDTDGYGNLSVSGAWKRALQNPDGTLSRSQVTLTLAAAHQDYFEDVGSDYGYASASLDYAFLKNQCWTYGAGIGAETIYNGFFDDWGLSRYPIKAVVKRTFLSDSPSNSCETPGSTKNYSVTLGAEYHPANPSTSDRVRVRLQLDKAWKLGTPDSPSGWSFAVRPKLQFETYTSLADGAEREDWDATLKLALSRNITDKVSLAISSTLGSRNSSQDKRDSTYIDAPFAIALSRKL